MKKIQYSIGAALLALALTVTSCGESSPTAPATASVAAAPANGTANLELLGALTGTVTTTLDNTVTTLSKTVNNLLVCTSLSPSTVSKVIGPNGGTINIGPHKLVVPQGALSSYTTITAKLKSENVNHVEFQPHGLDFAKDATLTMSYANCDLLGSNKKVRVAYTTPDLKILYYLPSNDIQWADKVEAKLDHFSDYTVAW